MSSNNRPRLRMRARAIVVATPTIALSTVAGATPVHAAPSTTPSDARSDGVSVLAVNDLPTVIGNMQAWIIGILAALATLFLVIGFARYMTAGGATPTTPSVKRA